MMMIPRRLAAVAATLVVAVPLALAAPVGANNDPQADLARAEQAARDAADRHIETLSKYKSVVAERDSLAASIAQTEARVAELRRVVNARAAEAYKRASSRLDISLNLHDAAELDHGAALLDRATASDRDALDELMEQQEDLDAQQADLSAHEGEAQRELAEVDASAAESDRDLAAAQARAAAARTARPSPSSSRGSNSSQSPSRPSAPSTAARRTPAPSSPAPPSYAGTGGTHPHHDDPFLGCVRARESGGNYGIVSASGRYLGAYQFLQSTWNAGAGNFGRSDLVGVPANHATPYDQDDVAWRLYTAVGNGPWGGGC
jgi:hypothetical protein